MELKKKISLDAEQILKESEVVKELSDSEMNHLKGGCFIWLFGDDTTTSGGGMECSECTFACIQGNVTGR